MKDKQLSKDVKNLKKKTLSVKQKLVNKVQALLKEVEHVLPIDLAKVSEGIYTHDRVFELEDGNNIIQLNKEDYDNQHPRFLDVNSGSYEDLPVSDLKEIVDILEDVSTDCYRTMKRCQN